MNFYCKCGCGSEVVLKCHKDGSYVSMQLVSDNFYTYQKNKFIEKLKRIWFVIIGKEYCYFDIVFEEDDIPKFKDFVAKM